MKKEVQMEGKLGKKDRALIIELLRSRSFFEACKRTGVELSAAFNKLKEKRFRNEIKELDGALSPLKNEALEGYRKIAFGNAGDALKLIFNEEPTKGELEGLELFNVSEIKRPKGGGLEIKFFDKLKALEKISQLTPEENEKSGAELFLERLSEAEE